MRKIKRPLGILPLGAYLSQTLHLPQSCLLVLSSRWWNSKNTVKSRPTDSFTETRAAGQLEDAGNPLKWAKCSPPSPYKHFPTRCGCRQRYRHRRRGKNRRNKQKMGFSERFLCRFSNKNTWTTRNNKEVDVPSVWLKVVPATRNKSVLYKHALQTGKNWFTTAAVRNRAKTSTLFNQQLSCTGLTNIFLNQNC